MLEIRYPDSGQRYEDANVLRNAVVFGTTLRARSASRILAEPFDEHDELDRAAVAVDAFEHFVVATEDTLGWLFALHGWEPGTAENCLFALLDRVQVGRGQWSEDRALQLLDDLGAGGFREQIAHLPDDDALRAAGWVEDKIELVDVAVESQRAGFREVAERRAGKERALARAFNKAKHYMLAMPAARAGNLEVDLLTIETRPENYRTEGIRLAGQQLATDKKTSIERASGAIAMQSVIHAMCITILDVRFGITVEPLPWAVVSQGLPGWREAEPREA